MKKGNRNITKNFIIQNIRIMNKYCYQCWVDEYKCDWEKWLRLQIIIINASLKYKLVRKLEELSENVEQQFIRRCIILINQRSKIGNGMDMQTG
jgi:hypothetical protein